MRLLNLFILCPVLLIGACAPALNGYEMMPKARAYAQISENRALSKNITAGEIVADKGMGGMSAPVTSEQYREALLLAFRQVGWYGDEKANYELDAHLIKVEQPVIGFDFTVKVTAEYALKTKTTGKTVYHEVLTLPCTVRFAEAVMAEIRIRQATACAVGENVTHLLKVLATRRF